VCCLAVFNSPKELSGQLVTSILGTIMPSRSVVVYVLIVVEIGKEHSVAKEIQKLSGVTETLVVYGEFDVVCRIEIKDLSVLDETVTRIRRIPGIIRTATLISSP